ncbi:nucleolar protein 12-domain-containing protein [Biscogniauxia sp. FL1348]|nr:nucleolar protein 12-domain-containing protein [Biscogniauxia sp. FL1348]
MFARPRPKKNVLSQAPRKRKAQRRGGGVEEIKFDDEARVDYLTGFHKRKVQRAKQAQEQAAKKARQDKIEFRKQLREDRKRQAEEHVQHVETMLKEARQAGYIDGGDDDDDGEGDSGDEAREWGGFQDVPAAQEDMVDHEEEYIDEERYTTVTVESVSVSKDGLFSSRPDEEEGEEEEKDGDGEARAKEGRSTHTSTATAGGRNDQSRLPKKKKPKFRYETKLERQISQKKERASNKRRPRD